MILSSPRLTRGISSGRSRNHGQNAPHQSRPSAAISRKGIGQLPQTRKSQINRNGIKAPPHRLNIQIDPWALPRSVMRHPVGDDPAERGKPAGLEHAEEESQHQQEDERQHQSARARQRGQGDRADQQRPAEHEDREDAPAAQPVAQQAAGHLEDPIRHLKGQPSSSRPGPGSRPRLSPIAGAPTAKPIRWIYVTTARAQANART